MKRNRSWMRASAVAAAFLTLASASLAQSIAVRTDRATGLYLAGQTVRWSIEAKDLSGDVRYRIKLGGHEVEKEGSLQFVGGRASVRATLDRPGWLLLEVEGKAADGKAVRALGGATFSPDEIRPSSPRPADFDKFWASKIAELRAVPMAPAVTPADAGRDDVEYSLIKMRNIRGTSIQGQMAKPKGDGKFPALLIVQWAGVYPLEKGWVLGRASQGWLTLNIQAHDLPVAEPAAFYQEQSNGPLRGYPGIGNDDRETSYFLRMYLSCYRAADYLAQHPNWDGKVMVVTGGSQGGMQTLVTAALHPKITAGVCSVPAGCDFAGADVQRAPGWPSWQWAGRDKDPVKVKAAGHYFDAVNFASRIKVPMLVGIGGIDTVCPPPGIYAALNRMMGTKEVVHMPLADHMGAHDAYYARQNAWMDALKTGSLPPR